MPENVHQSAVNELLDKYRKVKLGNPVDLSADQDLTVALMNLIGIEEHLFFSGARTQQTKYYQLIREVRNLRKELLGKVVTQPEGEEWCIAKHLLAASYRLMEVGTKQLDRNLDEEAYKFFTQAYELYSLFWGLIAKLIPAGQSGVSVQRTSSDFVEDLGGEALGEAAGSLNGEPSLQRIETEVGGEEIVASPQDARGTMARLGDWVKRMVNCCIE